MREKREGGRMEREKEGGGGREEEEGEKRGKGREAGSVLFLILFSSLSM